MPSTHQHLEDEVCERARQARDPRFDGRFFVCVKTTGIYCRPVCPVRIPMAKNVIFRMSASAAEASGFRPCLRCRPESAPATPAWNGTSTTVTRALRLIEDGFLDDASVEDLGDRLGVGARHLTRLFGTHLGASPKIVAETRRLQLAKRLLDETTLPMTDVAAASGYGSIRRFNAAFKRTWQRSPTEIRKTREPQSDTGDDVTLNLRYRPPFDWDGLLTFLGDRAIPGVEDISEGVYRRSFRMNRKAATLKARHNPENRTVAVTLKGTRPADLPDVIKRVRRLFDLDADPMSISADLGRDRDLEKLVRQMPGQRIPGAFDGFEIGVRAIIGQQVSVKSARSVAARLAATHGQDLPPELVCGSVTKLFPTPEDFLSVPVEQFGLPKARARTILALADAVEHGVLDLSSNAGSAETQAALVALPGIGPWTASYVALRVLDDPDAFPEADLALLKVASDKWGYENPRELLQRAESWRPWRGYAALHLWRQYPELVERKTQK